MNSTNKLAESALDSSHWERTSNEKSNVYEWKKGHGSVRIEARVYDYDKEVNIDIHNEKYDIKESITFVYDKHIHIKPDNDRDKNYRTVRRIVQRAIVEEDKKGLLTTSAP